MLTLSHLRSVLRWSILGVVGFVGAYVYSQLHAGHPVWTDAAREGVFPVLRVSGAWMWRQRRVMRWVRDLRASAAHA